MKRQGVIYKCDCCGKDVTVPAGLEERVKTMCAVVGPNIHHEIINTFQIPELKEIPVNPRVRSVDSDGATEIVSDILLSAEMTEVHLCKNCAEKFQDTYLNIINLMQEKYCDCLADS